MPEILRSNQLWYAIAATVSCVLAAVLADSMLKRKWDLLRTGLVWFCTIVAYLLILFTLFMISSPVWYDWFLFFGWIVLLPIPCLLLYSEKPSTKMFLIISTVFIGNLTSFMSGSITSVSFPPTAMPWTEGFQSFIVSFTIVKICVSAVAAFLLILFMKRVIVQVFEILDGKMMRFVPIPFVASIGFFFITQIVQIYGLTVDKGFYFLAFYLLICFMFGLMYWLIFSNATWSSRAMRTEAEMNVASKIQQDMLPQIFPVFAHRNDFDIFATMQPAKEVGGDFYDFFLIDDKRLAVVIADVSGKGVPAALFMVIAKTLIKDQAQTGISPSEVFTKANNLLCESNGEGMFVTAFMGVLDIETGRFIYVNAGHNLPLIKQGDKYEWLKARPGFVLAGMEDTVYRQAELILKEGDKVYLYTDGVTEALNQSKELYSDPRLLETINNAKEMKVSDMLAYIKNDITLFASGAEQADDITMLALEYHGYHEAEEVNAETAQVLE